MGINIGTEGIGEIYVGTESIGRVYAGTELVWEKSGGGSGYTFTGTGTAGFTTYSTASGLQYSDGTAATRSITINAPELPDTGSDNVITINTYTVTNAGAANTVVLSNLTGFLGIRRTYSTNLGDLAGATYHSFYDTVANANAALAALVTAFGVGFHFGNLTIVIT